jgi:hypothetical protein
MRPGRLVGLVLAFAGAGVLGFAVVRLIRVVAGV